MVVVVSGLTAVRSYNHSKRPTIAGILKLDPNVQYDKHKVVLLRTRYTRYLDE
jgi:hypothetical protein